MINLVFFSPGEKVKKIRQELGIKQIELEEIGVSRNYISMLESDKRNINIKLLRKIIGFFQEKAKEKNIDIFINEDQILLSAKEEAQIYCEEVLNNDPSSIQLQELTPTCEKYELYETLTLINIKLGNMLYSKALYNKAFNKYYSGLELCNFHSNIKLKTKIYTHLGNCKIQCLNYEEALRYLFKAYFNLSKFEDIEEYQKCIFSIAIAYKKTKEYDNALIYINKLSALCDPSTSLHKYVDIIILEANCYIEQEQYQSAIRIYNQLLRCYESQLGALLGFIYNNLGFIYLKLKEITKSIEYFDKAIKIREQLDRTNLSHSIINKAEVFIETKNYEEAIKLLLNGLSLSISFNENEYILIAYKHLAKIYKEQKDISDLENTYLKIIDILEESSSPDVTEFYAKLSILYLDSERYSDSKAIMSKILTISK